MKGKKWMIAILAAALVSSTAWLLPACTVKGTSSESTTSESQEESSWFDVNVDADGWL